MENILKNLIEQSAIDSDQTTAKTTFTPYLQTTNKTGDCTYTPTTTGTGTPKADSQTLVNKDMKSTTPQQGWQCPVCGAVMSPWSSVCINCHGNWNCNVTWKFNPYEITCKTGSNSNT